MKYFTTREQVPGFSGDDAGVGRGHDGSRDRDSSPTAVPSLEFVNYRGGDVPGIESEGRE
jgi:hypothetical protein